jgi:ABC-type Fe3+/spermidine/putrescine transport system ATPase subunit
MRIMAGLERPDSGDVFLEGRSVLNVPVHKRNVGLVFQDLALFPHKTVRENVAFGLRMRGVRGDDVRRRVDAALDVVELSPALFGPRLPGELSGGQRQRVAVARTIVVEPSLVLFDEPMAALDRRLRDRMALELRRIQKQLGLAAIYVTHDQETASMMSDRIAVMFDGRIVQVGAPLEVYRRPKSRFVADFLGDMNFLSATVIDGPSGPELEIGGRRVHHVVGLPQANGRVTVGIRPEQISVRNAPSGHEISRAQVKSVHFISGNFLHRLVLPDGTEIQVRSSRDEAAGQPEVWLFVDAANLHILPD